MAAERCCSAMAAVLLAAALAPAAWAAPPHRPHGQVPLRLLEFLGQSDPTAHGGTSDGARWMLYLSRLNLGRAPPRHVPTQPKPKSPAGGAAAKRKASG